MKFRSTRKEVSANFRHIISVPYCDLQTVLNYMSPIAYTVRREGWGCDVYDCGNGVAISTGYAPFGNVQADHNLCMEYERQAHGTDAETRQRLLKAFIADCIM